jgi:hypothetical protein
MSEAGEQDEIVKQGSVLYSIIFECVLSHAANEIYGCSKLPRLYVMLKY